MNGPAHRLAARRARGGRARREGRAAEVLAAFWLMLRGYRLLGFRMRLQGVEVDLAVRRGHTLVIFEVKRRRTLEEALHAVTPVQLGRLRRAGEALAQRHAKGDVRPDVRLDLLALVPGRPPRHIPDAWAARGQERAPWR